MIRPLDTCCWTIDDPSDGEWHWGKYESAVNCLTQILGEHYNGQPPAGDTVMIPVITHQPAPCWIAYCDDPDCGEIYGDPETEDHIHGPDEPTLKRWMSAEQWTFDTEGRAWCQDHSRQEIPGQLTLDARQAGRWIFNGASTLYGEAGWHLNGGNIVLDWMPACGQGCLPGTSDEGHADCCWCLYGWPGRLEATPVDKDLIAAMRQIEQEWAHHPASQSAAATTTPPP
jgi:hypothetical protein